MCRSTSTRQGDLAAEEVRGVAVALLPHLEGVEEEEEELEEEGHYVCDECAECAKTNQFLLSCLNHMLAKLGEEEMGEGEWEAMAVTAKMQVFLYVHRLRAEVEQEEGKVAEEDEMEGEFNSLVEQLL